jgi:hypothetical protein
MIGPGGLRFLSYVKIDKNSFSMPMCSYSSEGSSFNCNSENHPLKYSEKKLLLYNYIERSIYEYCKKFELSTDHDLIVKAAAKYLTQVRPIPCASKTIEYLFENGPQICLDQPITFPAYNVMVIHRSVFRPCQLLPISELMSFGELSEICHNGNGDWLDKLEYIGVCRW